MKLLFQFLMLGIMATLPIVANAGTEPTSAQIQAFQAAGPAVHTCVILTDAMNYVSVNNLTPDNNSDMFGEVSAAAYLCMQSLHGQAKVYPRYILIITCDSLKSLSKTTHACLSVPSI